MALDDVKGLENKKVLIEVQSESGNGDYDTTCKTLLYWGTFERIAKIGSIEMILLKDAKHYSRASVIFNFEDKKNTNRIQSKYCLINQKYVISIDLDESIKRSK